MLTRVRWCHRRLHSATQMSERTSKLIFSQNFENQLSSASVSSISSFQHHLSAKAKGSFCFQSLRFLFLFVCVDGSIFRSFDPSILRSFDPSILSSRGRSRLFICSFSFWWIDLSIFRSFDLSIFHSFDLFSQHSSKKSKINRQSDFFFRKKAARARSCVRSASQFLEALQTQ